MQHLPGACFLYPGQDDAITHAFMWMWIAIAGWLGCASDTARFDDPAGRVALSKGELNFTSRGLDDAGLQQILTKAPPLTGASLLGNRITEEGVSTLLRHSPHLARLDLSSNPIGDEGLRTIGQSRGWSALRLSDCGATSVGVQHLLPSLGQLEYLTLGKQPIGDASARALAPLPLHTLNVVDAGIGSEGAAVLLQNGQAQNLYLDGNDLSSLPPLPQLSSRLVVLTCSRCGLAGQVAKLTQGGPVGLQLLRLHDNQLHDADLDALASAPWLSSLKALEARNTDATPAALARLVAAWGDRPGLSVR